MNETTLRKVVKEVVRQELTDVTSDVKGLKIGLGEVKFELDGIKIGLNEVKKETRHNSVILEHHTSMLETIGEGFGNLADMDLKQAATDDRLKLVEDDMDIVKPVVKAHSRDIAKLKSD